jgi:hypothetical protein
MRFLVTSRLLISSRGGAKGRKGEGLFGVCFAVVLALLVPSMAGAESVGVPPGTESAPTELSIEAPVNNDGLNLDLTWTDAVDPALYALVRRPKGEQDWTVVTETLPGTSRTYSDKVTTDPRLDPPAAVYEYRLHAFDAVPESRPEDQEDAARAKDLTGFSNRATAIVEGTPSAAWLRTNAGALALMVLIVGVGFLMLWFTDQARKGKNIEIRRIPGIDAIEEGIGRATEMGKPVLYVPGIDELQDIQTIASMLILGQVSKTVAEYQSDIIVSCCIPIVREVADDVVRAGFFQAGHPDAYNPVNTRFISSEQFAFCAGTNGIIHREKPATNLYLGRFFAESLILAETGFVNKSIQIAGTAEATQLPFFIAACDYTLIGEELFAVSAYLSGDPRLVSSLKASDWVKVVCVWAIVVGTIAMTLGSDVIQNLFTIGGG